MSMELMVKAMKTKVGNPLRKLVLLKLADNASDHGECWPSYQHIADQCEMSRRSVMDHIAALIEAGLLKKEIRKGGPKGNTSNVYTLTLNTVFRKSDVVQEIHQGGAGDSLGGAGDSLPPSAGDSPRTSHSLEPVNEPTMSNPNGQDAKPKKSSGKAIDPADLKTAQWIFGLIRQMLPTAKEPNWNTWASQIRLLRVVDGRTHREICELFRYANKDSFWRQNILSPEKLRKQWDSLTARRLQPVPSIDKFNPSEYVRTRNKQDASDENCDTLEGEFTPLD